MKPFLKHLRLAVALAAFLPAVARPEAEVGKPAPDFSLPANDGKTYSLSDFREKFVVLEWTNQGCPFVRKHYDSGNMQKLQEKYLHKGVVWLSIISSAPGKQGYLTQKDVVQQRINEKVRSTATLLDPEGKVGRLYGAKTTPHMFVIDKKGVVIYAGAIDDHATTDPADVAMATNYVALALDAALADQPVSIASTPSYGCSVKYKN